MSEQRAASNLPPEAGRNKLPRRYTLEEYLQRESKSAGKHAYFDGRIVRIPVGGAISLDRIYRRVF